MASATIVKAYQDGTYAYIIAVVAEGGSKGNVEYNASVPLTDLAGLTNPQKKAALIAAVKAARDAQVNPAPTDLSAIASGVITI